MSTLWNWFKGLGVAMSGAIALCANSAIAQIIPDGTLPNNSRVTTQDNISIIEGGTRADGNLFHSFKQFSILPGCKEKKVMNSGTFKQSQDQIQQEIEALNNSNLGEVLEKSDTGEGQQAKEGELKIPDQPFMTPVEIATVCRDPITGIPVRCP